MRGSFLCAVLLSGLATHASAQSASAAYPESIVAALQANGLKAVLGTDSRGDPKITSAAEGLNFSIFFYGCSNNATCKDIQFIAGLDLANGIDTPALEEWNKSKILGMAYRDADNDPFINHYIAGFDGVSESSFARLLNRWTLILSEFKQAMGFS